VPTEWITLSDVLNVDAQQLEAPLETRPECAASSPVFSFISGVYQLEVTWCSRLTSTAPPMRKTG